MENLQTELNELRMKFEDRIRKGEFEVIKTAVSQYDGYIGEVWFDIDGVRFHFILSECGRFYCDNIKDIELSNHGVDFLEPLYKALHNAEDTQKDKQKELDRLEARVLELKGDLNQLPTPDENRY